MHRFRQFAMGALLVFSGCGTWEGKSTEQNRLVPIVRDLRADDLETRMLAINELKKLADAGLTEDEGLYALQLASEDFPALEYEWQDSAGELVFAASTKVYPSYPEAIETRFAAYSPVAQAYALRLLGKIENGQAVIVLMNALAHVSLDTRLHSLGTLAEKPRHAEILFPGIVQYVRQPNLQWPLAEVFLAYLAAGMVDDNSKREISAEIVAIHNELQKTLVPLQQERGEAWIWEDAYQNARSLAAIALDILGHVGTDEAKHELSEATSYTDPRLKMFAIVGLLRLDVVSEQSAFEVVAASAESRNWLYRNLDKLDRLDLFPARLRTQEYFAESDMVNWLTYPTELARVPDEIELMAVVPREYSDGIGEFYVFRFRTLEPHWAAEDGWTVGISGPFRKSNTPTPESLGGTFSDFTPWDACSADEHVTRIENLLDESRKQAEG